MEVASASLPQSGMSTLFITNHPASPVQPTFGTDRSAAGYEGRGVDCEVSSCAWAIVFCTSQTWNPLAPSVPCCPAHTQASALKPLKILIFLFSFCLPLCFPSGSRLLSAVELSFLFEAFEFEIRSLEKFLKKGFDDFFRFLETFLFSVSKFTGSKDSQSVSSIQFQCHHVSGSQGLTRSHKVFQL